MYSPDGRWWWDGTQWVPAPQWRTRYEDSAWTRQLQVAVLAVQAIGLIGGAFILTIVMGQVSSQMAAQLATGSGGAAPDPQATQFVTTFVTGALIFGGVLTLALLVVMVVGVLKLWRWVYWYLVVSYAFAILSIPGDLVYVLSPGPIHLPAWTLLINLPLVGAEIALMVWMLVAYRRHGTWARRRIVEPVPA